MTTCDKGFVVDGQTDVPLSSKGSDEKGNSVYRSEKLIYRGDKPKPGDIIHAKLYDYTKTDSKQESNITKQFNVTKCFTPPASEIPSTRPYISESERQQILDDAGVSPATTGYDDLKSPRSKSSKSPRSYTLQSKEWKSGGKSRRRRASKKKSSRRRRRRTSKK